VGFAMIYKLMPRVKVRWHDVWLGAAVTALLFTIGRFLIGLYIGRSGIASGFGAAGSLVIIFVWVYYSAQIFLMGAEFTWVYARTFGSMRFLATPANSDEAAATAVPLRSEVTGAAVSRGPEAPPEPRRSRLGWKGVCAGFGMWLCFSRIVPRLIQRQQKPKR
jgi:hypothetical protein